MWIILLDRSGSMADPFAASAVVTGAVRRFDAHVKIEAARQAVLAQLDRLDQETPVRLCAFNTAVELIHEGAASERAIFEEKLSRIQIIDESKIAKDQVLIGAKVVLKDLKSQEEITYHIVTHDEANFDEGKLSVMSPIAKGLLGLKVGESAEIKIPAGTLKYKVLKISR